MAESSSNATTENGGRSLLSRQESIASRAVDSRFSCNICLDSVCDEPVVTQCGHLYCWPCLYRWLEPGMLPEERASLQGDYGVHRIIDDSRRVCPVCKSACAVPTLVPIYIRSNEPTPTKKETKKEEQNQRQSQQRSGTTERITVTTVSSDNDDDDEDDSVSSNDNNSNNNNDNNQSNNGSGSNSNSNNNIDNQGNAQVQSTPPTNVPSRPAAMSPRESPTLNQVPGTPPRIRQNNNLAIRAPLSPNNNSHPGSLSHGLLLSFQRALPAASDVPSIHQRNRGEELEVQGPDATEFLSRLILMLASFVLFCLLIF